MWKFSGDSNRIFIGFFGGRGEGQDITGLDSPAGNKIDFLIVQANGKIPGAGLERRLFGR
jgi:hypothetical protein